MTPDPERGQTTEQQGEPARRIIAYRGPTPIYAKDEVRGGAAALLTKGVVATPDGAETASASVTREPQANAAPPESTAAVSGAESRVVPPVPSASADDSEGPILAVEDPPSAPTIQSLTEEVQLLRRHVSSLTALAEVGKQSDLRLAQAVRDLRETLARIDQALQAPLHVTVTRGGGGQGE